MAVGNSIKVAVREVVFRVVEWDGEVDGAKGCFLVKGDVLDEDAVDVK